MRSISVSLLIQINRMCTVLKFLFQYDNVYTEVPVKMQCNSQREYSFL